MEEGWYLMSVRDLEIELARQRGEDRPASNAKQLSIEEALEFRSRGNLPDDLGRTLRLVLRIDSPADLKSLDTKRLLYEPDFHRSPTWRGEGSKPVNVVPLTAPGVESPEPGSWWDDPEMAQLESEWRATGAIEGIRVPAEYRSFVYKTVTLLRKTGTKISVGSISDSIARWLSPEETARIRESLTFENKAP